MIKRIDQLTKFLKNLHEFYDFMIYNDFELMIYVIKGFIVRNNSEDK